MKSRPALAARTIAYIAVMCALLTGAQYVFGFVAGVEVVTVLLLCFSVYFGITCGVLTAVSFALLRCVIWGIYPTVLILYLVYYPLFALIFALLGKIKRESFDSAKIWIAVAVNIVLIALGTLCLTAAVLDFIKVSRLYKTTLQICLYIVFGLCAAGCISFNAVFALARAKKIKGGLALKLFLLTCIACVCTACFTLLDDIITPLVLGMERATALAYFYASFTSMLPQVICTAVTVAMLYTPVTFALTKACPEPKLY